MSFVLKTLLLCLGLFQFGNSFSLMNMPSHDLKAPNWNDLKVTWGANPFSSEFFVRMPRTEADAVKGGWIKEKSCGQVNGNRYIFAGDRALILVFNAAGIIAGVSSAIPKGLPFNFPSKNQSLLMQDEGDVYTITAYFVDPTSVCSKEASLKQNTGDRLVFKGSGLELDIPLLESDMNTFWTLGQCFWTMGVHYWADISGRPLDQQTDADNFVPIFLQYNKGKLNGFGFGFNADLKSPRYEHPTTDALPLFFKSIPAFMNDKSKSNGLSTLHIYLDSTPQLNFC